MIGGALTIWDCETDPLGTKGSVYRWSGYAETGSARSLLRYIDEHAEHLRRKFRAWIYELGEYHVSGKRIIEHLALRSGISYWWLTRFVEQSPWESPGIVTAIRLFALEEIISSNKFSALLLVGGDKKLHKTLEEMCLRLGINYSWEPYPKRPVVRKYLSLRRIYQAMPRVLQAPLYLAHFILTRLPLRQRESSRWFRGNAAVLFCSYFFNIAASRGGQGDFRSRYWEDLHNLMAATGRAANWLQIYYPHDAVPDTATAQARLKRFNAQPDAQSFHAFVDSYISWRIVLRVLAGWFQLIALFLQLRDIDAAFKPRGAAFSLWHHMSEDWRESLIGPTAVSNLLWLALYDAALKDIPHQSLGLYLYENQAWERAFVFAWRKHGHGRLVGVAHSTLRFWDLRYFLDARISLVTPYPIPQADQIALNGQAALDAWFNADCPGELAVPCEALRYGYLDRYRRRELRPQIEGQPMRVLLVGDYLPASTSAMLRLVEGAAARVKLNATYVAKPHPNTPIDPGGHPLLQLGVVTDPLGDILHDFDIAISTNTTSAAVDAYFAGLPVVVVLDETELNFSPLRGRGGVHFVATPGELADVLQQARSNASQMTAADNYFFLDAELPRWRSLLSSAAIDERH